MKIQDAMEKEVIKFQVDEAYVKTRSVEHQW